TAVLIMIEEFGEDLVGRLEELARSAKAARRDGVYVPKLHKWVYELPEHFLKTAPESAMRLARCSSEAEPENARLAVNLARIHRDCNDAAAGAEVLARFTGPVGNDRSFWYEWGTCAGNDGDPALNALLAGWSLADEASKAPPDTRRAKLSLAGLGVAFGALRERFAGARFDSGRSAVAWLGLRLDFDARARSYFERHRDEAQAHGASTTSLDQAISQLRDALTAAWEISGRQAELADRIRPPKLGASSAMQESSSRTRTSVTSSYTVEAAGNDTHGAGAVRFDTKSEDGADGPDGERYYNYARLVRGGAVLETPNGIQTPIARIGLSYSRTATLTISFISLPADLEFAPQLIGQRRWMPEPLRPVPRRATRNRKSFPTRLGCGRS
ncbi:MAG: hypothetical protein WBG92_18835, partial [Thiohalocapsa sp.]